MPIKTKDGSVDYLLDRIEIERERASRKFKFFIHDAWPHIESSSQPLVWGWALGAIVEHLEAVTANQIRDLLITVPPGFMKSLTTAVLWTAWEWGPKEMPWLKYLLFSYHAGLSLRDNRRCRLLITSDWYRARWGKTVRISPDQAAKNRYETTEKGFRQATTIGGLGTGERANRLIVDDPHHVKRALSDVQREEVLFFRREVLPSRIVNPATDARVTIMQRVHEKDYAGDTLANEPDIVHLCIPMRFEPTRICYTQVRPSWYKGPQQALYRQDPRTTSGELAFPQRFPESVVKALENTLGPYGTACQLQQSPAPRGGGMFRREAAKMVDNLPPKFIRAVRWWDLAGGESDKSDWSAGVKTLLLPDRTWLVADVCRFRIDSLKVLQNIKNVAMQDGPSVIIGIPQDPGDAGKFRAKHYARELAPLARRVVVQTESGDKVLRADPVSGQWEAGNFSVLRAPWNEAFFYELETFPASQFDDQVDALANSFRVLCTMGLAAQGSSGGF
jgi:predicted phage terminase large subunit-like protein